jgi:hypothetical protein
MIFGGIFEKLPNLRVAFAHGGGSFPATFGRITHGFDERPDLLQSTIQLIRKTIWENSGLIHLRMIKKCFDTS